MKIKNITFILATLALLNVYCSLDKSKLTPKETNGFTSQDMDTGQNNDYGIYPHIIDIEISPTGDWTQPPWVFYIRFDIPMDTTLTPDVKLEEITGNNQTSGTNAIDTASVRWSAGKDNELTFKTGSNFKIICNQGPPVQYCDNYLLTINSSNTRSALGIQMDGNWNDWNDMLDDYISAPSDYVISLMDIMWYNNWVWYAYPSFYMPWIFNWTYLYDLWLADVWSSEDGDYLNPNLSIKNGGTRPANLQGYIGVNFNYAMNKSDINNTSIEIRDSSGKAISGDWYVDTNGDNAPDTLVGSAPNTTAGNCNSYYSDFWFKPTNTSLALGRYTGIVHCNSLHKVEALNDTTCNVYQKPYLCTDFDYDGNDNDRLFEFYVTSDGDVPNITNRVWGVYTTNDTGPFGVNEIKTNQAFVLFQTPDPRDNLMDETTLIPENISLLKGGDPVTITTSVEERYFRCAKSTVWILNAPQNINLNNAYLTIKYAVKDKAGNTLDGNGDLLYELNPDDNFIDTSLPYDVISNNNPPANYVQTDTSRIFDTTNNPKGFTINQNQVFIVFDTPAESDDRMNWGSLSDDDLQLSGAGTGSCTCTCPGGSCAGDVTLNPVDDTTNFSGLTTVWQITFNNPAACNVKDCTLTIRGGSVTAAGTRPTDICGNWLYPNYTQILP
jgi:hypothetical protein